MLIMALSGEELIVMADSGQIEQVVINLATNARDAMPDGGTLTIRTHTIVIDAEFRKTHGFGEPGKYALISVEDTGAGIDEQTKAKIFEPFFTTKDVGKGTGLGLAIVYGIIKQHHGYINVYSELNRGTNFRIYLPSIDLKAAETPAVEYVPVHRGTETILLVEDEKSLRAATGTMLAKYGYSVIEAEDGIDAIAKFREHKNEIALVLIDVIMPRKNGKEAYQEILAIRPDTPAIFMSGYISEEITDKILAEGWELLSKPVFPKDLFRKIRAKLDRI
jgi:CheY-like chemotaxis protein